MYISIHQAVKEYPVPLHYHTLLRYVEAGLVPAVKVGKRFKLKRTEFEAWLNEFSRKS